MQLPVVYICVNNQYAYSTPLRKQMAVESVAKRASAYGMPVEEIDGNDPLAVYASARRAIERARTGNGPSFIECWTYRMTGHGSHDDASYVPKTFFADGRQRDPILRFTALLTQQAVATDAVLAAMDDEIASTVGEALRKGEAGPLPDGAETLLGVYAE